MAITWELGDIQKGKDENVVVTVKELSDGVLTEREYTARLHKKRAVSEFKQILKEQILADREKQSEEDTFKAKIDLTDFETFINS